MNIGDVKVSNTATARGKRARIKKKQYMAPRPARDRRMWNLKQDVRNDVRLCGRKRIGSRNISVRTLRKKTTVSMERLTETALTRAPIMAKVAEAPRTKRAPATGWFPGAAPTIVFFELEEAEEGIVETMRKLRIILNDVYGKTIVIPELENTKEA